MTINFTEIDHAKSLRYVETWFWNIETLAAAVGLLPNEIATHIQAGCLPGPIYAYNEESGWWSALAAYMGKAASEPADGSQLWYSPASLWWARKTLLLINQNMTLEDASKFNETSFVNDFTTLLPKLKGAELAYPGCFEKGDKVNLNTAKETAVSEWQAWTSGAYGVCLRDFTANTCIRKESLGALIKRHLSPDGLSDFTKIEVLQMVQELSSLVTPFSHWERESGTPGQTIDVILKRYKLGVEFPYPLPRSVDFWTSK